LLPQNPPKPEKNSGDIHIIGSYLEPDKKFGMGYLEAIKLVFLGGNKQ